MHWGQEENWLDETLPLGKMKTKGNAPLQRHPAALPSFASPLGPLSSFTFTLHPAGVDLAAGDGWRGSDAVYRIGLRGLAVSAACKVASAV